jgi:hypothetical protein
LIVVRVVEAHRDVAQLAVALRQHALVDEPAGVRGRARRLRVEVGARHRL